VDTGGLRWLLALPTLRSYNQVKRERDAKLMDLHSGTPWETLTLTTLSSSRDLFPSLLSEARSLAESATEGKTVVYTAWGVEWRPFGKPRRRREMGSVVLGEGVAERVESDLRGFLGRGKWYAERGGSLGWCIGWLIE
jgi:chaperone BCS1